MEEKKKNQETGIHDADNNLGTQIALDKLNSDILGSTLTQRQLHQSHVLGFDKTGSLGQDLQDPFKENHMTRTQQSEDDSNP